jgi:hypothetical protein
VHDGIAGQLLKRSNRIAVMADFGRRR